ncbi:hypothetical protein B0I03_10379 [Flavobacterium aquaticum]|uniref:Uncharacterized protein n=1 Tax=Flavobacterium aquaticum TaxID=1236486 RepID=A0A327YR22_9FLAO|nr:hypothetical protein [Flavobacterium aquaticum]RAK23614.1 hypothetical protein B0I03_10379 [Flavobacterium aquaticum]
MFKKSHIIKTSLSKEEIIAILQTKVENFHRENSKFDFEGNVNLSGEINIKPTFDYGPREQFRPEILGKIHGNQMDLEFQLSAMMKKVLWIIILIEPLFIGFVYFKTQDKQVLLFFPFLIVFMVIFKFTFDSKVKKAITLLESYFK